MKKLEEMTGLEKEAYGYVLRQLKKRPDLDPEKVYADRYAVLREQRDRWNARAAGRPRKEKEPKKPRGYDAPETFSGTKYKGMGGRGIYDHQY